MTLWRSSLSAITGSPLSHQREAAFDPMARRTPLMSRGESTVVADSTLEIGNLPLLTQADGWTGPGCYLLPLEHVRGTYRVAAIPRSPGFARA